MWALLLLLLCCAAKVVTFNDFFGGKDMIPAILGDAPSGDVLYNLRLTVGTPLIPMRFVADFRASKLILVRTPKLIPDAVVVRVGAHRMLMDYIIDPFAPDAHGCPECDGVFPLGAGSPIWLIYRNVTITSGAVYFEDRFDPASVLPCRAPVSEFCITPATILGFPTDVYVVPNQAETILPGRIFNAYEDGRDIATTPWYLWDDLVIDFGKQKVTIPRSIIYQKAFGESPRLMVEMARGGQNFTVLGTSALRAIEVYRDFNRHVVGFRAWPTERNYGIASLLGMLFLVLALFRWLESPPIFRITRELFSDNTFRVGFDVTLEICVMFFPVALIIMEGTYRLLFADIYLAATTGVTVVFVFGWGVFTQLMFWANAPERIAFLTNKSRGAPPYRFRITQSSDHLPLHVNVGIARQRQIREYTYEMSLLISILFIAIKVRQDSLGTFISVLVYLAMILVMMYHLVASIRISAGFPSLMWYMFVLSSIVVNIFFILALHTSVFVTGLRKYVPRNDDDLLFLNILIHIVFILVLLDYSMKKSDTVIQYISDNLNRSHYT